MQTLAALRAGSIRPSKILYRPPVFRQFIIPVSGCSTIDDLREAINGDDWKAVDDYFSPKSEPQSNPKVTFQPGFEGDESRSVCKMIENR